jgi:hypothetical protein
VNALSEKRGEFKLLEKHPDGPLNIGAQRLSREQNITYTKEDMSRIKNLVETILLDDIVDYLPPTNRSR